MSLDLPDTRDAVAAPRANPPIIIGPFSNVPAPGSPIRSDWPQQITNYVVNALSAQGVTAIAQATINGGSLATLTFTTISNPGWGSGGTSLVAPAGTTGRFIVSARLAGPAIEAGFSDLIVNVGSAAMNSYVPQGKSNVSVSAQFDISPGNAVSVQVYNPNGTAAGFTANLAVTRIPAA